jgi:hypothetical protein
MLRALFVLMLAACSGSVTADYDCSGHSCMCADNGSCSKSPCDSTTSSCAFTCDTGSTCSGTCGDTCSVICNGASCTFTAGPNANLNCNQGKCDFTCNGICDTTSGPSAGVAVLHCQGTATNKSATGCH